MEYIKLGNSDLNVPVSVWDVWVLEIQDVDNIHGRWMKLKHEILLNRD